jgi:serine/threonine-protein kinase
VTRFVREARLAGRLNHTNIVSVYGMGLKEQTPYYAMEFVEGETLAQILGKLRATEGVRPSY